MKYNLNNPPVPLDESTVTSVFRKDIGEYVPRGGFIEDFVLYTRGIETPTKFAVWSSLYILSALLKRDAYMDWFPNPLYPNLFLILIAPPRICAKSTCVTIGDNLLQDVPGVYSDPVLRANKTVLSHRSKVTPEMLFDLLEPKKIELATGDQLTEETPRAEDKPILPFENEEQQLEHFLTNMEKRRSTGEKQKGTILTKISELSLIISELTTFLGKQKYNETLVDVLTYFYDCPDRADEATRTYGAKSLRNVYLTFFGATTPDSFVGSLPETAFGGGFLSRTILVANYLPTRSFPIPSRLQGAPDSAEMAQRLGWVGATAWGAYQFSKEAYDEYVEWYDQFHNSLVGDPLADAKARMDTNLVKLCVLIRAQRYQPGRIISRQDFLDAKFLLTEALLSAKDLYSGVNGSEYYNLLRMISDYIERAENKTVTRAQILREFTVRKITPDTLTQLISHLMQTQQVEIFNGNIQTYVQTERGTEQITYTGSEAFA